MSHFLVIEEGMYERSQVYGIFDSLAEARAFVETSDKHSGAACAQIEEWDKSEYKKMWDRPLMYSHPLEWKERL